MHLEISRPVANLGSRGPLDIFTPAPNVERKLILKHWNTALNCYGHSCLTQLKYMSKQSKETLNYCYFQIMCIYHRSSLVIHEILFFDMHFFLYMRLFIPQNHLRTMGKEEATSD